jgi:hypothetical protein
VLQQAVVGSGNLTGQVAAVGLCRGAWEQGARQ